MGEKFSIPDKGEGFVLEWANRIKPLISKNGKVCHFKNKSDHFTQSYPWNAKPGKEATDIEEVGRIRTLHGYGYYGFFKPSVAEVLQQIPEDLLSQTDYFLVNGPETASDLNEHLDELNDGYHVAETILYRKK